MQPIDLTRPGSPDDVARLLPPDVPARPRALAVLEGVLSGYAWVDDLDRPSALLVIEDADGTVYGGGGVTRDDVVSVLAGMETKSADLIFGFAGPDDPMIDAVPAEPYWRGEAIDFTDRLPPDDEVAELSKPIESGAQAMPLDAVLLPRTEWYEDTLHAFGSPERWEELGVGVALMLGDEMVAECLAGPRLRDGLLEMGVVTRERYRGRGYGTLVSRLVARSCEARGDRVWWNANAGNLPSLAIARRLGFRTERRYDLVACRAPLAVP